MLQNAYLLAKIGADAAENEPNVAEFFADRPLQAAPAVGGWKTSALIRPRRIARKFTSSVLSTQSNSTA